MNPLLKTYYLLRPISDRACCGCVRAYISITGEAHCRKSSRSRPWSQIALGEIMNPGTPTDTAEYASFKRQQKIAFLFPPGKPPACPIYPSRSAGAEALIYRASATTRRDEAGLFLQQSLPDAGRLVFQPDRKQSAATQRGHGMKQSTSHLNRATCGSCGSRPAALGIDAARTRGHGFNVNAGEMFWRMLNSWIKDCPPFMGFQWRCGQESSVRFIAVALSAWALADDPAVTPMRWEQLAKLAWATGHRIAHHMHYAVSQKNNHALSEACGLMLIAHLFPELREAQVSWWDTGKQVMAREIRRQVYDDGSYVQSSVNYERVMLHVTMLAIRLAESGRPAVQAQGTYTNTSGAAANSCFNSWSRQLDASRSMAPTTAPMCCR